MRSGLLPSALLLAICLVAWPAASSSQSSQAGLRARSSLQDEGCRVVADPAHGLPRKVFVPSIALPLPARSADARSVADRAEAADPAHAAAGFLQRHAHALFGREATLDIPSDLEWRTQRRSESRTGVHLWRTQHIRGVEVEGAWLRLQVDERGRVLSLESRYEPELEGLDLIPSLSAQQAQRIAREALDREGPARLRETTQLLLDPTTRRLVWKITEALWAPFGDWQCRVDARTGELLSIRNLMSHGKDLGAAPRLSPPPESTLVEELSTTSGLAQGSLAQGNGWVLPANPLNEHPERYDLRDGDPVDSFRESKVLERLDGSGMLRGDYVDAWLNYTTQVNEPSLVFEYSADQVESAFHAVNAYWHIDTFQDYLQNVLGINDANNRQTRIFAHALVADNSVYSPLSDDIRFGDGGVDDAEDGEVVLHEYGHAIHENIVPNFVNLNESGAISEGFGDYVAASYGANPLVAEWDATAYQPGPPPHLRRTDGTKHYPEDLENQVHADGEIISAVWWRLWNELGAQLADALVVESFFLLGPTSDFGDFADAMLQVDQTLFAGAHLSAIHSAYSDRGIPISYPLVISTAPLPDTEDLLGPYTVEAQIAHSEDLAVSNPVQLYWRLTGQGSWSILPMDLGQDSTWSAEIPGTGVPAEVEYSITVIDALDVRVWSPEGGPEQFYAFRVAGDDVAPVLTHQPLGDTSIGNWPAVVQAEAIDASGIASVRVDWFRNGAMMSGFALVDQGAGSFAAEFPFPALAMSVGDHIEYIITATDAATEANTSQSGPHSFTVIQSRGNLLVLVDAGDPESPAKYGPDKEPLPFPPASKGASGQLLADHLSAAGFSVSTEIADSSDPAGWTAFDLLVFAGGSSTTPAADADFRDDLLAWVSGGGKLLIEGGEIGYDASSNPGYADFAREILHVERWEGDDPGDLSASASSALHPLRNTPHALPDQLQLQLQSALLYGDQDSMVPAADAQLIYGTLDAPGNAGILVFDDNTHPGSAQIVYWAFAYGKLADLSLAAQLADNSATHLLADEPAPSSRIAGVVSLKDGGSAANLDVQLTPSALSTTTDATGAFAIAPLHAGNYLLEVVGPAGYETARIVIQLGEGENLEDQQILLRPTTLSELCDENAQAIPDADADGILRELDPAAEGEVVGIKVELEIEHNWRGDLRVELRSPIGTTVVLHNRSGSDLDDLRLVYPDSALADGPGRLTDFLGEDAEGSWTLYVADLGAGDTGSFLRACLQLETAAPNDVPVLASTLRGTTSSEGVRLAWETSAGVQGDFAVLRAVDSGPWQQRNPEPIAAVRGNSQYLDETVGIPAGARLSYRLQWSSEDGTREEILSEFSLTLDQPALRRFELAQNHPNPFNPRTTIVFSLVQEARSSLRIYDVQGRLVATLRDEVMSAGEHRVIWDGSDHSGRIVAAGTYIYELRSRDRRVARSMVLLK